jgi:septal ring factor EnvC (AmiA/AmiB activator)
MPEAMDSASSDEEHNSGLVSRYQIKLREPKADINLNEPAPADEFPEFKVKIRSDKEKIRELRKVVKQLKKEKAHVEQWSARQQEKIQGFKKKKREQRALLKELREVNFKLYWHNIVLTTKLKQKTAKATTVIIP